MMAHDPDEPKDYDPEDPEDTSSANYDAEANVRAEAGVTPAQKRMQEVASRLDKDPALLKAYQLAQHPASADFDFTDPKNLEALRTAAEDLKKSDPAEVLKAALDQHLPKLTPEAQQELAAHFLKVGGQSAAAPAEAPAQVGSTGLDFGGMTGGASSTAPGAPEADAAAPAPAEGVASAAPGVTPQAAEGEAPAPAGAAVSPGSLTPAGALESKSALADAEAGYKMQQAESQEKQQKIRDDVELNKQEQFVRLGNQYKNKLEEINGKYQKQMDGQLANYRQAVDDLRAFNPDIYTQRSTGWNIGAALAIGLNQAGVAMAGNNASNTALTMIRDSINRDMEQAQMGLDVKRGGVMREGQLLERMREVWGDEKTALAATHATMWEHVKAQAERELANKAPELRGLHAQETVAKIGAEHMQALQKMTDTATALQEHRRQAEIAAASSEARVMARQLDKQNKAEIKAAGDESKAASEFVDKAEGGKGTSPSVRNAQEAIRLVGNARNIVKSVSGKEDPTVEELNKLSGTQVATLVSELAKIAKGGAATEGESHMLTPNTTRQKWAKFLSDSTNRPVGAEAGAFVKDMLTYLKDLKEGNQEYVNTHRRNLAIGYLGRIKNPETRKALVQAYPEVKDIFFPPDPNTTAAQPAQASDQ